MMPRLLARLRSLWRNARHRSDVERHMSDDWQFHIARHAEHLMERRGVSRDEAIRIARLEFGTVESYKEQARQSLGLALVDALRRDVRYASRSCAAHKSFTAGVGGILAIAIGANAAVYTLVDRLLMRPLPYPHADQLGTIVRHYERAGQSDDGYSVDGATWLAMRDAMPDLDVALSSGAISGINLSAGDAIAYVQQHRVSAGYFRVLGVAPAFGREFTSEEDQLAGPPVAVLSHALWSRTLGADPDIVGRAVTLRGEPFVVVGVMPEGFHESNPVDVWTPLRPSTRGEGSGGNYSLIARLRPGVAWAEASQRKGKPW